MTIRVEEQLFPNREVRIAAGQWDDSKSQSQIGVSETWQSTNANEMYIVPAGKTLYLTQLTLSTETSAMPNVQLLIDTTVIWASTANTTAISHYFSPPIKYESGETVNIDSNDSGQEITGSILGILESSQG